MNAHNTKQYPHWETELDNAKSTSKVVGIALILTFLIAIFAAIMVIVFCPRPARAAEPPANLYKGLIAESCSEGYTGMYAVACVVRNRIDKGMTPGLCALKRKDLNRFVLRQGKKQEQWAKEIVERVFFKNSPDITGGATHYENIQAFGSPKWAKKMKVTCKIGRHTFMKEARRG